MAPIANITGSKSTKVPGSGTVAITQFEFAPIDSGVVGTGEASNPASSTAMGGLIGGVQGLYAK